MDTRGLDDATVLSAAIRAKEVSSRELLELFLARHDELNPAINAVVTLDIERARAAATAADAATARGEWFGPLHGLPTTIKDAIETGGLRSTGGARELATHVPTADAPAVARLKAAGAFVFGKTNAPRWSGDLQTFNELFGTTNNPWDLRRTPGGSSGGAAAAVATGLTSFELGTDIGGSVRIPSSWCGVCGHKPSWGLVSQRGYLDHVGGGLTDADLNVFGPIARSARDLDLLLGVLAGPDADRAAAWRVELAAPRHRDLSGYRIGTWLDDPAATVDSEVGDLLQDAAAALARGGAQVDGSRPPIRLAQAVELFGELIAAAVSPSADPDIGDAQSGSHRHWLERDEARARMRLAWAEWFTDHDVLLCPVMPMAAFGHDQDRPFTERTVEINGSPRRHLDTLAWTGLVGVSYLPSTVVPIGRTRAGLPVGIQVVGPYLEDRSSLAVAAHLEQALGGYVAPPLAM
jgi:amidase